MWNGRADCALAEPDIKEKTMFPADFASFRGAAKTTPECQPATVYKF